MTSSTLTDGRTYVLSHLSTDIPQLAPLGASSYVISPGLIDYNITAEATRIDTASDLRSHVAIDILKQENPNALSIFKYASRPHNANNVADEFRSVQVKADSIRVESRTYPYQIRISLEGITATSTPLEALATKHLATIGQMTEEFVVADTLRKQAQQYQCVNGKNTKKITELTIKDLLAVTAWLRYSGMQKINQEIIATTQISTSGVPRSWSLKTTIIGMHIIKQTPEIVADTVTGFQYAGSTNYADNIYGVIKTPEVAVSGSNFFGQSPFMSLDPSTSKTNVLYEGLLNGANTYMIGTSPFTSQITTVNPAFDSPSALYALKAARFSIVSAVLRPEGLWNVQFTAP